MKKQGNEQNMLVFCHFFTEYMQKYAECSFPRTGKHPITFTLTHTLRLIQCIQFTYSLTFGATGMFVNSLFKLIFLQRSRSLNAIFKCYLTSRDSKLQTNVN